MVGKRVRGTLTSNCHYGSGLQDMSEGKVTAEELRISAQGRPGHPPLNLLDLPGPHLLPPADHLTKSFRDHCESVPIMHHESF